MITYLAIGLVFACMYEWYVCHKTYGSWLVTYTPTVASIIISTVLWPLILSRVTYDWIMS